MPEPHISYDDQKPHGRKLRSLTNKLNEFIDELQDWLATSEQMKQTGTDGTDAAHWATLATKAGFDSNQEAMDGFNEAASLKFKLTTNDQQVDVANAVTQFIARFS
jgi:hypothetical protein